MSVGTARGGRPTRTTVMVLNYNGRDHVEACLESLGHLDVFADGRPGQPRAGSAHDEVWLIDNASTDGSPELVESRFPWVRVIRNGRNLGFPLAYNLAAEGAKSDWIVFLNDDTRVAPGFLSALHRARARHGDAFAVAAKLVSWDGERVDFVGADTFFTGHAWQRGLGEALAGRSFPERRVLFGCAGGLLVDRRRFLEIGGFDPDYFSFFEDVDLGWRAALFGLETWLASDAVVHHKHHGSWGRQPQIRVSYLTDRNALFTAFKNYDEERMGVMLLLAAALTFLRGWYSSAALRDRGRPLLSSEAVAHFLALADLPASLPHLTPRREQVQAGRRCSDADILPLFGAFASLPQYLGERYLRAVRGLCGATGITDRAVGGPFPPSVNAEAREISMMLARACVRCVRDRYPSQAFVAAGWLPEWEHDVDPTAARTLAEIHWALESFSAAELTAESLHALRTTLDLVGEQTATPEASPAVVRRLDAARPSEGIARPVTVSVVIRTLDRPVLLGRALASVGSQSLLPVEVVVVNDGGTDPSDVLSGFRDRFPIMLVSFPTGVGRSRAAQAGLEAASGTHVLFLDDDDELRPEHLETLARAISSEGVRVAYTDVDCVAQEEDGAGVTRPVPKGVLGGPFDAARLWFENTIPIMAVLMDRALALEVGGFDPSLGYFEDWDLWLRLARRTPFHHCAVATAVYHLTPEGSGAGLEGAHRWPHLARLFDKHRDELSGKEWAGFYSRHVEPMRRRLAELEEERVRFRLDGERRAASLNELERRLRRIEGSRLWRLYARLRRLLGRR